MCGILGSERRGPNVVAGERVELGAIPCQGEESPSRGKVEGEDGPARCGSQPGHQLAREAPGINVWLVTGRVDLVLEKFHHLGMPRSGHDRRALLRPEVVKGEAGVAAPGDQPVIGIGDVEAGHPHAILNSPRPFEHWTVLVLLGVRRPEG